MDLSLVSWEDLVDEMQKRNDALIIYGLKDLDGRDEMNYHIHGSLFTVLGMTEDALDRVHCEIIEGRME